MAGTYGEPGKNEYSIKGVAGRSPQPEGTAALLSNVVNAETGITQIYRREPASLIPPKLVSYTSLGTYNPKTKTFTVSEGTDLTNEEKSAFIGNIKTIKEASIKTAINAGLESTKAQNLLDPNTETTDPNQPGTPGGSTPTDPNPETPKQQPTPQSLKYPQDLHADQDTIKFTAVQYIPPGLEPQGTVRKPDTKRSLLGTVTLPIQSMISDSNRAEWNSDQLNEFYRRALDTSTEIISGKTTKETFDPGIRKTLEDLKVNDKQMLAALGQYIIGIDSNLVGRTGGVLNQNLELLFTGPTLRPFTFNFKMIARDEPEGEEIKRIINFFKRNMAPKKGNQLFLKAPNTFMIKYTEGNDGPDQKGLNKIKECALLACNVTYTPNGTYMTYKDGTMVEYQMTLSFQELEPVYDTDYDDHPIGY